MKKKTSAPQASKKKSTTKKKPVQSAAADSTVEEILPSANRIDVKIGFRCNNFCRFCVQGNKRFFIPKQDHGDIKSILKKSADSCDSVVFTGGEPTMQIAFLELVCYAADNGFKNIQIQTNGRLFSSMDFCKKALDAGATEFSPALHGHIPELHDYLTRAPGSFRETVAGIINLKKLNKYVGTNTVITRSNYRHLPHIAGLLVKLGVDHCQFAFVHAVGRAAMNFLSIVPRKVLVEPYVKAALDIALGADRIGYTEAIPYCFMRGYERCISEEIMPETKIFDAGNVIEDFTRFRLVEGKVKGPKCAICSYNSMCEGPWREYPEKYGWDEFVPREDTPEREVATGEKK